MYSFLQLEDAEFAKNAAIKARQSAESDFSELQSQMEEALRAKKDTEDKLARVTKEKSEVQTQVWKIRVIKLGMDGHALLFIVRKVKFLIYCHAYHYTRFTLMLVLNYKVYLDTSIELQVFHYKIYLDNSNELVYLLFLLQ